MSISKKEKKKIINWNNTEENLWCDKRYRKKEIKKKEREVSKKSLPRWIVGIIWTFAWMKAVTPSLSSSSQLLSRATRSSRANSSGCGAISVFETARGAKVRRWIMNRNEATLNPLRLIPMRCSSKLPARYPDAGLHIGGRDRNGGKGGLKRLQRAEHIVLSLSRIYNSRPGILFYVILLASSVGNRSQVNSINCSKRWFTITSLTLEIDNLWYRHHLRFIFSTKENLVKFNKIKKRGFDLKIILLWNESNKNGERWKNL